MLFPGARSNKLSEGRATNDSMTIFCLVLSKLFFKAIFVSKTLDVRIVRIQGLVATYELILVFILF